MIVADPVVEQQLGGVFDALGLLEGRSAAKVRAAAGQNRATADIEIHLQKCDGCPFVTRRECGEQPTRPSADDDDVVFLVPSDQSVPRVSRSTDVSCPDERLARVLIAAVCHGASRSWSSGSDPERAFRGVDVK